MSNTIQWICIGLALLWLCLSFVFDSSDCITRSTVFIAAAFVIGALR